MTTTDETTPVPLNPDPSPVPVEPTAPTEPESRRWVTVHYDADGTLAVQAHALQGYGARSAAVHVDVADVPEELKPALDAILASAATDLDERAQDAVSEHRTLARQRQEDHRAPLAYVGPEVLPEDGVFSSPHIMELPAEEREAAIREGR